MSPSRVRSVFCRPGYEIDVVEVRLAPPLVQLLSSSISRSPLFMTRPWTYAPRWARLALASLAAAAPITMAACLVPTPVRSAPVEAVLSCRQPASGPKPLELRWIQVVDGEDRALLDAWCQGVGSAVHQAPADRRVDGIGGPLAVVSWNVNVGAGDLGALVEDLQRGRLSDGRPVRHFVLLLQEALRRGPAVPPVSAGQAGAQRLVRSAHPADIETFARASGLFLFYVPSMRNGFHREGPAEDRGNAILSTLPLSALRAVELPFERQRRVAVAATLEGLPGSPMTVASVHLDAFVSSRRLWFVGATDARRRQARVVADALPPFGPLIIGGDFNTWRGVREPAVAEMQRISDPGPLPQQPTFINGRVLDYLFFRIPDPAHASYERASHTYGSDHFPLIGWVEPASLPLTSSTH
jgi:endonuclease/exonuclease/phosphatase family metal-dependent hydrolase